MSMIHWYFLFDYQAFRPVLRNLIDDIEKGDLYPLFVKTMKIRSQFQDQKDWIFAPTYTFIDTIEDERNIDYGHWLYVVLSSYLKPAPCVLGYFLEFYQSLKFMGWLEDDIDTLFYGESIQRLVFPDLDKAVPSDDDAPFWAWIRGEASHRGCEFIEFLNNRPRIYALKA
ncbi:MAG TPA: hypothetical protein PKW33_20995 [Anaerolineaceae bacterium]|nr:hypothetical protein [Anaerolineaceae bacterium]HPN54087.1 hypothetical protein [Anaerolineaceae bacterium]